ncbi:MAG: nucleotide-binding protein [Methanoregula sp.]
MKIGNTEVKVSLISIGVFVLLTILLIIASLFSPDVRSNLFWLIPCVFMLLVIPVALNYMSRKQYADLAPEYEEQAKTVRVKMINENMIGKIVRINGVVERVHYQFLNRPQYSVADRSGAISVKMFTSPDETIKVNDIVEVLGQVIRRYIVTGEPVINCVSIRKNSAQPASDD